jgi:large subunit ribosomal protein L6
MDKIVAVPEGVKVEKTKSLVTVYGTNGELKRDFRNPNVTLDVKGSEIKVSSGKSTRRKDQAIVGTWAAHLRNMVSGVTRNWEGKMKIVHSHFPMKVKVDGEKLVIENFLGERKPRAGKIMPGTEVKIEKDVVIVSGSDKEKVGQTCGNIELATKITRRDKRVFQDGIYITSKPVPVEEKK